MAKYIKFFLSGGVYGADITPVREILLANETPIYKVPNAPRFLMGMINLRGALAPLVDLRVKLGFSPGNITSNSRIIICHAGTGAIAGALVDELAELVETDISGPIPSPDQREENGKMILIDLSLAILDRP